MYQYDVELENFLYHFKEGDLIELPKYGREARILEVYQSFIEVDLMSKSVIITLEDLRNQCIVKNSISYHRF